MDKSIVEERICSRDFSYLQPYFYNNPYALRCELGMGDTCEEYMENAKKRAMEIYQILFPIGADAIVFDHWIYDCCDSGEADREQYTEDEDIAELLESTLAFEAKRLRFLLENQMRYRHVTVADLEIYDSPSFAEEFQRRNRVICYSDGIGFDYQKLICQQIEGVDGKNVSFISFEQECIFSIYDDRGCDVVFMTHNKLREFYHKLQPYFLEYDIAEMERRYNG